MSKILTPLTDAMIEDEMRRRGFLLQHTGGNCTAYILEGGDQLPSGCRSVAIYVTQEDMPLAPESLDDVVDVVTYAGEFHDELVLTTRYPSLRDFLAVTALQRDE